MTIELKQYKCPSCGQKLTEEEYWHVCQIQKSQIDQMLEKELEKRTNQLEQENAMELQQEKLRLAKYYEAKERELEAGRVENAKLLDEKISQAIIQNDTKHRQKEKESELKYGRIESTYKELVDKFEKLEKAWNNIPPELRGTAGELVLQDELEKEFKTESDIFTPKKVGVEMADLVQTIVTENGQKLRTPIAYDKKMGDRVSSKEIEQAKRYKTIHATDHVLIVTAKGIRNNQFTEKREGIVLVHPIVLPYVARITRNFIIETAKYEKNSEALKKAEARLFDSVTSPEYNRICEMILDIKPQFIELQTSDDRHQKKTSEKRSELVDRLFELIYKNHSIISDIVHGDQKVGNQSPSDFGYDV